MNFKRVLALVLVFAMCLSMIPSYAFADFDEDYGLTDEADLAAQNETVPEGDVYIDDEGTEEPSAEPVVEPVAEEPAEPEDAQVVDLGELGEGDAATFADAAEPIATGNNGRYYDLQDAVNAETGFHLNQDCEIANLSIDHELRIVGNGHTITGNLTISAPADAKVTLENVKITGKIFLNGGELVVDDGNVNVSGDVTVNGGTLSISKGTYGSATAMDAAAIGNVTGGTFTNGITDYLCAADYAANATNTVVEKKFVAQIGEGISRVRYAKFADAIEASTEGDTIILLKNAWNNASGYPLETGKTLKVNKNGFQFNCGVKEPAAATLVTTEENGVNTYYAQPKEFEIEYVLGGGVNGNNPESFTAVDLPITLKDATKVGSTFNGWTLSTGTDVQGPKKGIQIKAGTYENVTATASWTDLTYTLIFDANNGTFDDGTHVYTKDGLKYNAPILAEGTKPAKDPTRTGYKFLGWLFEDGTAVTATSKMPAADTIVKANWSDANVWKIDYILNGGTNNPDNPASFTVEDPTITIKAPTKEGYTFEGWYVGTKTDLRPEVIIPTNLDHGVRLTANWKINWYNITFNANGGKIKVGADTDAPTVTRRLSYGSVISTSQVYDTDGTTIINVVPDDPTYSGYTFLGWQYLAEDTTMPASDVTFYAQWSNPLEYTITYMNDGDNPEENPATFTAEDLPFTLKRPTKEGNTFQYWETADHATYTDLEVTSVGNKTYTAVWEINEYTLTLNAGEGYFGTDTDQHTKDLDVEYDDDLATYLEAEENKPSRDGYDFSGWSTEMRAGVPETMPASELTLYAVWEAKDVYILVNDGVNKITITSVKFGEPIKAPVAPEKPGYSLEGWYAMRGNVGKIPEGSDNETGITVNPYINVIMDAFAEDIYEALQGNLKPGIDVSLEVLKSIIGDIDEENITDFDTLDEALDKSNIEMHAQFDINLKSYHNFVYLHADWEIDTNDITYDANGGTFKVAGVEKTTHTIPNVEYGTATDVLAPEDPTRLGYNFVGWTLEDGTEVPEEMPATDLHIIANWEPMPVYVIVNDGVNKMTVAKYDFDEPILEPTLPSNPGHTFEGWYAMRGNVGKPDDNYPTGISVIPYIDEVMEDFAIDLGKALAEKVEDGIPVSETMLASILKGIATPTDIEILDEELDKFAFETHATFPVELNGEFLFVYLHADWEVNEYDITYDANGGKFADGIDHAWENVPYGTPTNTYKPTAEPKRDGYTFDGYTLKDGAEIPATMPDEDLEIIANWKVKQIKVTVDYNDDETPTDHYMINFGEAINHPTDPVHEGWTLTAWEVKPLDDDFDEDFFAFPYTPTEYVEEITVTASWEINKHTLTFGANGGAWIGDGKVTTLIPRFNVPYATPTDSYIPDAPERDGYAFTGWTAWDGSPVPATMPDADLYVIANWELLPFYVITNYNDGKTDIQLQKLYFGDEIPAPTVPEWEGHTFEGWYAMRAYLNPEAGKEKPTGIFVTPYVSETVDEFVVFLRTATSDKEFGFNLTPDMLASLIGTKTDWNVTNIDELDALIDGIAFNAHAQLPATLSRYYPVVYLHADWEVNKNDIVYDANGGEFADGKTVDTVKNVAYGTDTDVESHERPTREGYHFDGWTLEDGTEVPENMPDHDLNIKANWTVMPVYVIVNNNNNSKLLLSSVNYGEPIPEPEVPTRDGWTFTGWYALRGNVGKPVDGSDSANSGATTVIPYLNDTIDQFIKDMDLALENQVKPGAPLSFATLTEILHSDTTIEDTWDVLKLFESHASFPINLSSYHNFVLISADWTQDEYTISYELDDGKWTTSDVRYSYDVDDDDFTLATPTKEGYDFTGWTGTGLDKATKEVTVKTGSTGNREYTANWSLKPITVHINYNNGSDPASYVTDITKPIQRPTTPKKAGYAFKGWRFTSVEANLDSASYLNAPFTLPQYYSDLYFKADWEKVTYNVTYHIGDGQFDDSTYAPTKYTIEDTPLKISNAKQEGYNFIGWKQAGVDGEPKQDLVFGKGTIGDIDLTAVWEIQKVVLGFETMGGTEVASLSYDYGTSITADPATTTRVGYTFSHWTHLVGTEWKVVEFPFEIKADETFYANWTPTQYTIAYELDGGTITTANPKPFTIETESFKLPYPTRDGYDFVGWTGYNLTEPTKDVTIAKGSIDNRTYTAHWQAKVVDIVVDYNTEPATRTDTYQVYYGAQINEPEAIEYEGHTLMGWVITAPDLTVSDVVFPYNTAEENYLKTIILKAKWSTNKHAVNFYANGGEFGTGSNKTKHTEPGKEYGTAIASIAPVSPVREGFVFKNWVQADGSPAPDKLGDADLDLYAAWEVKHVYVVTNYNDTSKYLLDEIDFTDAIEEPAYREFEGHTLNGWYALRFNIGTKNGQNGTTVNPFVSDAMDGHIEAILAALEGELKDGIPVTMDQIKAILAKVEKSEGIEIGVDYLEKMPFDMHASFPFNLTNYHTVVYLYADWATNKNTLTYNANGGEWADGDYYKVFEKVFENVPFGTSTDTFKPEVDPKRDGYVFKGYVLEDGTRAPVKMPDAPLTLFADWVEEENSVTYQLATATDAKIAKIINPVSGVEVKDGKYSFDLKFGETIPAAPDVEVEGYSYEWVEETYGYNAPATMPAKDLVFTLKLNGRDVTYTFDADGGLISTYALGYKPEDKSHSDLVSEFNIVVNPETYAEKYAGLLPTVKPVKEGYEFHGWIDENDVHYDPDDFGPVSESDNTPHFVFEAEDKTFVAEWVIKSYNVTFTSSEEGSVLINPNTGLVEKNGSYTQAVPFGTSPIPFPDDPTRDGYTFGGWDGTLAKVATVTDANNKVIIEGKDATHFGLYRYESMPARDMSYVALWTADEHSITFNAGDGEFLSADKLVVFDDPYVITGETDDTIKAADLPVDPTLDGYTFQYWIDEHGTSYGTHTDLVKKLTTIPSEDLVLTAVYKINSYSVTFNGWGGLVLDPKYEEWAPVVITPNVAYGTEIVYPIDPVRSGYVFNGWKDWAYGVTNPETMPDHALFFRADWEAEEHSITFNAGDGEFITSDGLVTFANPYVVTAYTDTPIGHLLPVNPTLEGYTFKYWLGDDGNIYNNVPVFMVPEDLVLTAIYDLNSVFVTYKPNNGIMIHPINLIATSSDVKVEYKVGDELIKPAVTRDGYLFAGWTEEVYGWNVPETVPDVEPVNDTRTLTLTARWVGDDYAITFNANGGTVQTKALAYNPSAHTDMVPEFTLFFNFEDADKVQALLPTVQPVRDGHTFHGWIDEAGKHYDAADFGDATTGYKVQPMNKVFTAEWEIDSFTAVFDGNFDELANPIDNYKWDGVLIDHRTTLPAPSGWYGEKFTFDSEVLYPESIVREGYTFKGWLTTLEKNGTIHPDEEEIGFTSSMKMPGRNVTFKAVWEKNEHTITIDANGGVFTDPVTEIESDTYVIKADYGTQLKTEGLWPPVSMLTREGYNIKGYICSNGKNYKPGLDDCEFVDSMPDEDIVLTVVWEAKTIKVSYDPWGGFAINPDNHLETNQAFTKEYKFGDELIIPEISREGYNLKGWVNEKYGYNIPATVPDYQGGQMNLRAVWEGEEYTMTFNGAGGLVTTTIMNANPAAQSTVELKLPEYTAVFTVEDGPTKFSGKLPTAVTAEGYTFRYWTDEDGKIYSSDYLISNEFRTSWKAAPRDMVFTAHWNINEKNAYFNANDGKVVDPFDHEKKDEIWIYVNYGEDIPYPDDPVRKGYTFKGWYEVGDTTNDNKHDPYGYEIPTVMPDVNLIFEARWEVNKYTYTFDANEGEMQSSVTDLNRITPYTVATYVGTHPHTFTSYSATGEYSDLIGGPWSLDKVPLPSKLVREGYTLAGWTDQDGNHYMDYNNGFSDLPERFYIDKDMVFTAEWAINSHDVEYLGGGGTFTHPDSQQATGSYTFTNVKYGAEIPTVDDPVLEGHTFLGWYCRVTDDQNNVKELGRNAIETMPDGKVTFIAQYDTNVHTITLEGNGGGWKDALGIPYDTFVIKEEYGTALTADKWPTTLVAREGYDLVGWSCNNGQSYKNADVPTVFDTMPDKKIVLTAEWKLHEYKVEFVGNAKGVKLTDPLNGKETVTLSAATTIDFDVKYGDLIPYPDVKFDGHNFLGWVEQTHGYNEIDTMPAENLKFFAKWEGLNYSVTFDAAGGIVETKGLSAGPSVSSHKDKVPSYTVVGTPDDDLSNLLPVLPTGNAENPSRQGYDFDSWVDEDGKHYTNNYLHGLYGNFPAKDKVFTALWTPERHSVKFDPNGGKVVNPKTGVTYTATYTDIVYSDDVITYPLDPTRVGYEFIGWQEVGDLKLGFAHPATMPAKGVALTFQAQWAPIANTVTYDANGGTLIGPEGYKYGVLTIEAKTGDTIYKPAAAPVRYGYTFSGWYDHTGNKIAIAELKTTMPAAGETYTARWTPYVITVNFYKDFTSTTTYETQYVKFDDYVNKPLDPENEGHTFEGWYTYNTAKQLLDEFDFSAPLTQFTGTGDKLVLNLVANWSINTYTVSYNANGGLVMGPENFLVNAFSITDLYGAEIHAPAKDPVREGYAFQGWFDETERKMWASDTDLPNTMPAGDLFLTAVWHVDYFDVVFDANDGHWLGTQTDTTIDKITHKVAFTDSIPVPADPVYEGYDFVGWNPVVPETMPGHAMTFEAQWQPAVYRVTFDVNGGMNTIPDQLVAYNGVVEKPASYSMYRNGYDFDGWYVKNANGTISTIEYDFTKKVTGNLDLIAKWTGKIVVLRWGDRNVYMNTQIARVGDFIVRPEYNDYYFQQLIRDGRMEGNTRYRLDPDNLWYPEPPEYVEQSLNGMMYTLNWIKQIQIIFLNEDGTMLRTMYIDDNTALADNAGVPNPQKEGYDLLWAVNGRVIDSKTPVTGDGTLVMSAVYVESKEETWTVTFNSNGGTEVKTQFIVDGENAAEPADPEKDGYKFIGWTLDGEIYDFKTPVTEDITLVAEYEEIPYLTGLLSMQLKNNFVLNYYVDNLREGTKASDYTISFNGGAEQTLTRMDRNVFPGVAEFSATQLLDSIPVVVKYQGEVVFEDEISVRAYCDKVFNAYGHDHNVSLVGISEAALNYGSAAQLFVGDEGVLANYGDWYEYPAEEIPYAEIIKSAPITGITDGTASLQLGSSVSQLLYAYHSRKAKMSDYTFLLNGREVTARDIGSAYVVQVPQIPITNLVYENTLTVIYHEGQADQETYSVTASPTAYMYESYQVAPESARGVLSYYLYNYYVATTLNDNR